MPSRNRVTPGITIGDTEPMSASSPSPDLNGQDIAEALRLFDETTRALDARARRLEEVLTVKQQQLEEANTQLAEQLAEVHRLSSNLDLLLASVASGVLAVDAAGRVTACNPAAREALVLGDRDPCGDSAAALLPDAPFATVLASGEAQDLELHLAIAAGDERVLALRLAPIRDPERQITGAVAVFDDITEMLRLRERAERGQRLRALGEMAAGVAHEIRNPLNGIEGFASLLQRDLEPDDRRQRHVGAIIAGVRHLNQTVTDLLAFTRPREPQRRSTPMADLIQECCDLIQAEAERDGGKPVVAALENVWGEQRLDCDPSQIRQVVLNLLQNACQAAVAYQGEAARVDLRLETADDGSLCLLVDDNGPGVPPADRAKLFTPFFTTKDHGTGLGLAVSHTLVNLHGGHLDVTDAPRGGARFRLILPVR